MEHRRTWNISTVRADRLGRSVLLPGDPARCAVIAGRFVGVGESAKLGADTSIRVGDSFHGQHEAARIPVAEQLRRGSAP